MTNVSVSYHLPPYSRFNVTVNDVFSRDDVITQEVFPPYHKSNRNKILGFMNSGITGDQLRERLREFMKERDLNIYKWSKLAKTSDSTLRDFMEAREGRNDLTYKTLQKLAEPFNMSVDDLLGKPTAPKVPLLGYTGAGSEIFPYDDHAKGVGFEMLDLPILTRDVPAREIIAVRIRGDSMRPFLKDGWTIFYRTKQCPDSECLNNLCVIKLKDGRCFIKELRKGSIKNRYTLWSYNADPIEDVEVEWVYPIISIEPR